MFVFVSAVHKMLKKKSHLMNKRIECIILWFCLWFVCCQSGLNKHQLLSTFEGVFRLDTFGSLKANQSWLPQKIQNQLSVWIHSTDPGPGPGTHLLRWLVSNPTKFQFAPRFLSLYRRGNLFSDIFHLTILITIKNADETIFIWVSLLLFST